MDQRGPRTLFMADLKFSCVHCGQHISCDEQWSGHPIQCPACQNSLVVPQLQAPPAEPVPAANPLVPQPPASGRPKLAAGATQVARPTAPGPAAGRRTVPRRANTGNPILKLAVVLLLLGVIVVVGFIYLPRLLNQAEDTGTSKTPGSANTSSGSGAGPLGEVNGAMDVSDALDGSAPSRPRPTAARPPAAAQPPAVAPPPAAYRPAPPPATNQAVKSYRRRLP
jgi:hypothetical protein